MGAVPMRVVLVPSSSTVEFTETAVNEISKTGEARAWVQAGFLTSLRHHRGIKLGVQVASAEPVRRSTRLSRRLEAAGVAAAAVLEREVLGLVALLHTAGEVPVRDVPVAVLARLLVGACVVEQIDFVDVGCGRDAVLRVEQQASRGIDGDGAASQSRVVVDHDG